LISASNSSQRRAIARRLALADASVEVSGPGRKATNRRRSVILPLTWSSCSRRASGEQTMIALSAGTKQLGSGPIKFLPRVEWADSWARRGGFAMADLFLLSEAQMRRIEGYFPLSRGIARVDDRRIVTPSCS
jgi:hypothetical protein